MVRIFHSESDRGAAILAGSFVEHVLGLYLKFRIRDKKIAAELFAPLGPLSNLDQRIAIAYAFDLISEAQYQDLALIRRIRNQFAHHPLETTFNTNEIKQLVSQVSTFSDIIAEQNLKVGERHRTAYLLACGVLCGRLLHTIEIEGKKV